MDTSNGLFKSLPRPIQFGLRDPSLISRKLIQRINNVRHGGFNRGGISVLGQDWDNLIVLDGCRYDLFENMCFFDGTLSSVISRGSATTEWLRGNFADRKAYDTVYVTANPMLQHRADTVNGVFHDIVHVWDDAWDWEQGTSRPEDVADVAIKAAKQYPNKRLIIHFLQPHYPFIDWESDVGEIDPDEPDYFPFWMKVRLKEIDVTRREVWDAYRENLKLALPHVERCVNELSGKTVTTADHGNVFGQQVGRLPNQEWGHPPGVYSKELVKVPWFKHEASGRKQIVAEKPSVESHEAMDEVADRLSQLGYMN